MFNPYSRLHSSVTVFCFLKLQWDFVSAVTLLFCVFQPATHGENDFMGNMMVPLSSGSIQVLGSGDLFIYRVHCLSSAITEASAR